MIACTLATFLFSSSSSSSSTFASSSSSSSFPHPPPSSSYPSVPPLLLLFLNTIFRVPPFSAILSLPEKSWLTFKIIRIFVLTLTLSYRVHTYRLPVTLLSVPYSLSPYWALKYPMRCPLRLKK